jgi:OmpA-OmpF porin, OOP family
VPPNFTREVERTGTGDLDFEFRSKDDTNDLSFDMYQAEDKSGLRYKVGDSKETLGAGLVQVDFTKPLEVAIWVQQGRVRAYLNGNRVVDVNQVTYPPIDHMMIERHWHTVSPSGYNPTGIRSVRLAESAPDFSTLIASTGKYVTHGIYFDTDSDHLKPESAPVIKQVAAALEKNPTLKLEIDGYTDSVGDANHNLDLSKRRAQAVQSVLVTQFGIDASRLTSNGMGAGNPIGSNDTPDGRATNRRVEFVKK